MTPDKRLDQLEPVIGEFAAQLDLHTAQLRRVNTGIATLIETTSHQSDDINFLLRGQADQREQIAKLVAGQAALEAGQAKLEAGQAAINERLDGFGHTLTAILNAVQKPSGN
ncbi:hypothetical protein [Fibrella aquatilis]|uniref:Uncharacterized protein n=1 Tax=Fibrella aquatilis TaxID=2817059 RepID=A0A939GAN9_9BACT|nr:hypothetical protein [Fibrella aquatilis]MBO0933764.1 hypothetical protein [Fibrella aquatilis]